MFIRAGGAVVVGVCGTDIEIVEGKYRPGRLLGRRASCWATNPLAADRPLGLRKRVSEGRSRGRTRECPDPVPCPNCAVAERDTAPHGSTSSARHQGIYGFMSKPWRIEPGA